MLGNNPLGLNLESLNYGNTVGGGMFENDVTGGNYLRSAAGSGFGGNNLLGGNNDPLNVMSGFESLDIGGDAGGGIGGWMDSDLGKLIMGGKNQMGLLGGGMKLLGGIGGLMMAKRQMDMMEDALDFNKTLQTNNYENQRTLANNEMRWKKRDALRSTSNYSGPNDPRLDADTSKFMQERGLNRAMA